MSGVLENLDRLLVDVAVRPADGLTVRSGEGACKPGFFNSLLVLPCVRMCD